MIADDDYRINTVGSGFQAAKYTQFFTRDRKVSYKEVFHFTGNNN